MGSLARLACTILAAATLLACSSRQGACEPPAFVQVPTAPPAPLEETDSKAAIAPGMTWVPGHWHWDDYRWLWSPGHWASTPAGKRWFAPEYSSEGEQHSYRPGGFRCADGDD